MPKRDPRVDAYIAKSAAFAKPILEHWRSIVDEACPDAEETMKWSRPSWEYAGALLCSMVAFKEHCAFNFWKAQLLTLGDQPVGFGSKSLFGHITSLQELPPRRALVKLVKQAAKLNAAGVKESVMTSAGPRQARKPLPMPPDLKRALASNKKARETFEGFSPSHRREYIEWITDAKRDATRAQRLATTVEWLIAGKPRNWKYMPG
jgi:uncharacterized protein YdeI (YjbR/CyaY-like superfamily)